MCVCVWCVCVCVCKRERVRALSIRSNERTHSDQRTHSNQRTHSTHTHTGRNRRCAEAFVRAGGTKTFEDVEAELMNGQKIQVFPRFFFLFCKHVSVIWVSPCQKKKTPVSSYQRRGRDRRGCKS